MVLDLTISDQNNNLTVIVEIKNKIGTGSDWAAKMRRNLLSHKDLFQSKFFLLALPDKFYLWKNVDKSVDAIKPNYEIDARLLLKKYYDEENVTPEQVSEDRFESIITLWLYEIRKEKIDIPKLRAEQNWLFESGLFDAILEGKFHYNITLGFTSTGKFDECIY